MVMSALECMHWTLSNVVPAKFVYLFEFCEFKIVAQVEMQVFIGGSADMDGVVACIHTVDIRPEQEPAIGQAGDGHAGMVEGKALLRPEAFFAIEQIAVGDAEGQVDGPGPAIALHEHEGPDTKKEDDLDDTEEEVDPG